MREKPTALEFIKEDAVTQTVGEDPDEDETGNDYMYNKAEKYVRVVDADPTPADGVEIEVSYKYDIPVIVLLQNASSIAAMVALEGGDGVHDFTIVEQSIKSKNEARQRALKELEQYANPLITGHFKTRTGLLLAASFFEAGQDLVVNSPSWGISIDTNYLIQEVITTLLEDGSNIEYNYLIRFGGRLLNATSFLESLAGQEDPLLATEEIDTIKAITEEMSVAELIERDSLLKLVDETMTVAEVINDLNQTPPFEYGPAGSPQGKWNTSEWG